MQNKGISLSPLKNVSSHISLGHEWKSVFSTPACGYILGKSNTNWQNSPRRGIAAAACGIHRMCVCVCARVYIHCIQSTYIHISTYTGEWGRWRACLGIGCLWNVLQFDIESESRDLTCCFSPAMTLGVIFPKQESPLITRSTLVLKAPLQFRQEDMHKVTYSTFLPHPSNDHRAINVHNPLEADLYFSLSFRLRCTRPESLPTPHLCLFQSID